MRILVVTNMYPPHHYGGYELLCRDVVERWRRRGHEINVLTSGMRVPGVEDVAEVGVSRRLESYFDGERLLVPSLPRRTAMERANRAALADALASQPDVVSLWHMGALSCSLWATLVDTAIPLVCVVCDDWLSYAPVVDPWMRLCERLPGPLRPALRALTGVPTALPDMGVAASFCFISECTRERAERYSRWSLADTTVVYSGIDPADFPGPPERGADRPWCWRLLSVGRLDPRKGTETAVRALAHLPQTSTLSVVGRGDSAYQAQLVATARELGVSDRVSFSVVERSRLASKYSGSDVFLFPTEWDEPFGLVPLEAMAMGTPVVATGTGGSGEFLVDDVNCVRVPPGDPRAVAAAVRRLATDADLRGRLVRGGVQTAAELNVNVWAEALERWHLAAAERFRNGRPPDRSLRIAAAVGNDG